MFLSNLWKPPCQRAISQHNLSPAFAVIVRDGSGLALHHRKLLREVCVRVHVFDVPSNALACRHLPNPLKSRSAAAAAIFFMLFLHVLDS